MTSSDNQQLNRSLGLSGAIFLGLGSIFGSGVFVAIGVAMGITGPSVVAAIMAAALLATCNALSSAQLAAAHPVSGGTYEYGYRLLTPGVGFSAGWLFLLAKSASAATAALGTIYYGAHLFQFETSQLAPLMAATLVLCVTALVCLGLRRSNAVNIVIVSMTLFCLIAFVGFSFFKFEPKQLEALTPFFTDPENPQFAFFYACALMFVAFTGYGRIATMGEEVKDPRRIIPRAIIFTLVISAAVYISVAAATVLSIPQTDSVIIKASATVIERAARSLSVTGLSELIAIGAVTAMLGVLLNLIMGLSRVVLAMSRRSDMPHAFAKITETGNPTVAVMVVGVFIAVLAMVGNVKLIWSFSALTVLLYYSITNLAALRLSKEHRLYPRIISVLGLIGCLSLTVFIPLEIWVVGVGLLVVGFIWRAASSRFK